MEDKEEELLNTNPTTAATTTTTNSCDSSLQRKHAAMLERLSNLHQSRSSRKLNSDSDTSSSQSTQSFLSIFSDSKLSIESQISHIRNNPDPTPTTLKSNLESISHSIADLEKLVAENSYLLPSYEIRTCLKTISDLKLTLDSVSDDIIPKKRFSFKNKPRSKECTSQIDVPAETKTWDFTSANSNKGHASVGVYKVHDSPGFKDTANEVLVKEFRSDGSAKEEVGEFMLSDLKGCEVRLMGCLRALFLHRLKDCKVYVGPVFGSVLIEEVESCVFVLASHQIRIHHAKGCDFYLRVRSRPIIEDSNGVRFAPYCLMYDGIEKDLEEANLGEETGNWANVDDFRWLRAVQSPNWSLLPEGERVGTVCISKSDA